MTKFTQEQLNVIEAAADKLYTQPERTHPYDLITEITKSDWEPRHEQVYISGLDRPLSHLGGTPTGKGARPLTTKEAGSECMQHLLDALEFINDADKNYWWTLEARKALKKHKDLIK